MNAPAFSPLVLQLHATILSQARDIIASGKEHDPLVIAFLFTDDGTAVKDSQVIHVGTFMTNAIGVRVLDNLLKSMLTQARTSVLFFLSEAWVSSQTVPEDTPQTVEALTAAATMEPKDDPERREALLIRTMSRHKTEVLAYPIDRAARTLGEPMLMEMGRLTEVADPSPLH
jgi:hypothetical protein